MSSWDDHPDVSRLPASTPVDSRPTVLVTGGSRGIGQAIGLHFGRAGWRVGIHYLERKREADGTVSAIERSGGCAESYQADVRDRGQVAAMFQYFVRRWGRIDAFICNAGISSRRLLLRLTSTEWERVMATNLTGSFHCLQAAGQAMAPQGGGSIVIIGSLAGHHGRAGQAAYSASKAGLIGLARTAAREWGSGNVRVNAVLPGWHQTALTETVLPDVHEHLLGRTPELQQVCASIYHLATCPDISGQIWNLDSRVF